MANRLPWFPLYVDDYLNDTYDLSPCEHGVYLLLLSRFWVSGPLRDNLDALCRVAAGAPPQMVREILERFWELTGQGWVNPRMQTEMSKSEAVSARAIAANHARWGKNPIKSVGAHIQMDVRTESKRTSSWTPGDAGSVVAENWKKKTVTKTTEPPIQMDSNPHPHPHPQQETPPLPPADKSKAGNDATPEGVDPQAWADFTEHRREIRKPLTVLSATKSANILREMTPDQQRESVNASITNRWTGIFHPKTNGTNHAPHTESTYDRIHRINSEIEARARAHVEGLD